MAPRQGRCSLFVELECCRLPQNRFFLAAGDLISWPYVAPPVNGCRQPRPFIWLIITIMLSRQGVTIYLPQVNQGRFLFFILYNTESEIIPRKRTSHLEGKKRLHAPLGQDYAISTAADTADVAVIQTHLQGSLDSPFLYSWMALTFSLPLRCSLDGTKKKDTLRHSGQVRLMSF